MLIAHDGQPLETPTIVADGLTTPEGFVVTANGFVVVEADTGQVVKITSDGERTVLAQIPPPDALLVPMDRSPPSEIFNGISMLGNDKLFVTGEKHRSLYRIDL